jgi:hypothetical protein
MLLFPSPPAIAADRASDEFLTGYIASILEWDLHWERNSSLDYSKIFIVNDTRNRKTISLKQ